MKSKDLTGKRFGRLTVIERAKKTDHRARWLCKCDCGVYTIVRASSLLEGITKSCGCLRRETSRMTGKSAKGNRKHSMSHTRIYRVWSTLKQRCNNPNNIRYEYYGDRKITVCKEWLDFEAFYEWSIANGYNDNLTIDRIDTQGNYEPSNCRWVTMKEQANNRRNNRLVTYDGRTQTISQWADEKGMKYSDLYQRLLLGWTMEKALTQPIRDCKKERKEHGRT